MFLFIKNYPNISSKHAIIYANISSLIIGVTQTIDARALLDIPVFGLFYISIIVLMRGAINGDAFFKRVLSSERDSFTVIILGKDIMIYNLVQI